MYENQYISRAFLLIFQALVHKTIFIMNISIKCMIWVVYLQKMTVNITCRCSTRRSFVLSLFFLLIGRIGWKVNYWPMARKLRFLKIFNEELSIPDIVMRHFIWLLSQISFNQSNSSLYGWNTANMAAPFKLKT